MDKFKYKPIALEGCSFRVLRLFKGDYGCIQCELFDACLRDTGDVIEYEALSYTWGGTTKPCDIDINGRIMPVTENLSLVLRHLRYPHQDRILWVDAICINQNDRNEKSEQVPMMGEIYSKAAKVYAWLGEGDPQIDCVFDVLREFADRKREAMFPANFDAAEQLSFYRQLFRNIYQDKVGFLPEPSDLDDDKLHEELNWLRPLYKRCYWRRVWIVQELVLAKVVVVCCGDKSIDFDDIYGLSLDWGSFEQGFDATAYQKLKPNTRGWSTIHAICGHRQRRREVRWEIGGEAPYLMSIKMSERGDVAKLDEVIDIYAQHHECTCRKDRVYGFRELVPQWKESLVVDYNQTEQEIFLDVAKLDLLEPKKHGGWHVAFRLWSALGLGDREKFEDCLQQHFPEVYYGNRRVQGYHR